MMSKKEYLAKAAVRNDAIESLENPQTSKKTSSGPSSVLSK
jgi:hypothetical protein